MNQMMGGMATSMAEMFSRIVNITPPHAVIARLSDQEIHALISREKEELIRIKFKIEIEGILNSSIMQLIPIDFGRQLVGELAGPATQTPAADPKPKAAPAQHPADVRTVRLPSFDALEAGAGPNHEAGLEMILDVPLQITVELGQCRKTIKDVMDFHIGSIVTLDKLPGEPVDVIVNGKAVARGEVIVIEDNYGIRVTEVLTSAGRVRASR
jgi:flagellar motor switch protein FliN/FliY